MSYEGGPAPAPAPKRQLSAGCIVVGFFLLFVLCLCSSFCVFGTYLVLTRRAIPGTEVSRTGLEVGVPQLVTAEVPARRPSIEPPTLQIWAEIVAQQTGPELVATGTVRCGGSEAAPIRLVVSEDGGPVIDYSRQAERVTAKILLHHEELRSPGAWWCIVTLQLTGATLTSGDLVVRRDQPPPRLRPMGRRGGR